MERHCESFSEFGCSEASNCLFLARFGFTRYYGLSNDWSLTLCDLTELLFESRSSALELYWVVR
jgi:hypothetical protein